MAYKENEFTYANIYLVNRGFEPISRDLWDYVSELSKGKIRNESRLNARSRKPKKPVQLKLVMPGKPLTVSPLVKRARSILQRLRERSFKKGLEIDLDIDWIISKIQLNHCEITGIEFDHSYGKNAFYPTIDRKNSALGYTKENCHMVVWIYNRAKNNGTHEEVIEMAKRLISHAPH